MATLCAEHIVAAPGIDDFAQGVAAAPDGSCVLYWTDNQGINLLEAVRKPHESAEPEQQRTVPHDLRHVLAYREGDRVHGCVWWPQMQSADPTSCVFLSSSKDHPIHMWDAYTGTMRASYCAYDHMDEPTAALSLAFVTSSASPARLVAGYNRVSGSAPACSHAPLSDPSHPHPMFKCADDSSV